MKYQVLFDNFIGAVKDSVPRNTKISAILTDILKIEKEAVYRRLRMEVPFTFAEIATVSQRLGISMDDIIDSNTSKTRPLHLKFAEYANPSEVDYVLLEQLQTLLKQMRTADDSEICFSCSTLPSILYMNYETITRFYLFKWAYLYGPAGAVKRFDEIQIPSRLRQLQLEIVAESRHIRTTAYIADNMMFNSLVNDIKYFQSIYLISAEDVQLLKKEILQFLADTESMAANGRHEQTGNLVNFYVSNINFETCYTYAETPDMHIGMIKAFILNTVSSQDDLTFQKIKNWLQSLKRVSTLISQSGEQQRILYFGKQRETVQSL